MFRVFYRVGGRRQRALLEEVAINPTIEPTELTQEWGNRLLEGTNRTVCALGQKQDPAERNNLP